MKCCVKFQLLILRTNVCIYHIEIVLFARKYERIDAWCIEDLLLNGMPTRRRCMWLLALRLRKINMSQYAFGEGVFKNSTLYAFKGVDNFEWPFTVVFVKFVQTRDYIQCELERIPQEWLETHHIPLCYTFQLTTYTSPVTDACSRLPRCHYVYRQTSRLVGIPHVKGISRPSSWGSAPEWPTTPEYAPRTPGATPRTLHVWVEDGEL